MCTADNFCIRVIAGPAPAGGGTRRAASCAADNFCVRVIWGPAPAGGGCTPSARSLVDLLARRAQGPLLISRQSVRAGHPHASAAPGTRSSAACLQTTSTRAWPTRVWAAGLGALATPRFAARPTLVQERLAKQAAGGHLVDAEDYVDAVYMVLAAAAHAQANAACDALVWNPPRGSVGRRLPLLGGLRKPGQLHALCRPPALWTLTTSTRAWPTRVFGALATPRFAARPTPAQEKVSEASSWRPPCGR